MAVNVTFCSSGGAKRGVPVVTPARVLGDVEDVAVAAAVTTSSAATGDYDVVRLQFAEATRFMITDDDTGAEPSAADGMLAGAGDIEYFAIREGESVKTYAPS